MPSTLSPHLQNASDSPVNMRTVLTFCLAGLGCAAHTVAQPPRHLGVVEAARERTTAPLIVRRYTEVQNRFNALLPQMTHYRLNVTVRSMLARPENTYDVLEAPDTDPRRMIAQYIEEAMARGVSFAEVSIRIRTDFERFKAELLACQELLDRLRLDIFDSHTFLNPEDAPQLPEMRRLAQTRARDRLGYYLEVISYILLYQYSPDQSGHIHWSFHD